MNHKPKSSAAATSAIIKPAKGSGGATLTLSNAEGSDHYKYHGSQEPTTTCALIFDPRLQRFCLDKVDVDFKFNLRSTPGNRNAKSLASQYEQLSTTAQDPGSSEDDLVEEGAAADPDNPYDYRHFLKRQRTSSPEAADVPSTAFVPVRRPSRPKAKPKQRNRPQPKRDLPPAREEADADNEDSDDGDLTIEMENPISRPRGRFNGAFAGLSGDGPISLRSAASSVSPAPRAQESSSESDEDVSDDMKLPPPIGAMVPTPGEEVEDEDDGDLEAELEQALESQADMDMDEGGGVAVTNNYAQQSSSESEEE